MIASHREAGIITKVVIVMMEVENGNEKRKVIRKNKRKLATLWLDEEKKRKIIIFLLCFFVIMDEIMLLLFWPSLTYLRTKKKFLHGSKLHTPSYAYLLVIFFILDRFTFDFSVYAFGNEYYGVFPWDLNAIN